VNFTRVAGLQDVQPQAEQLLLRHLASTPFRVHSLRVFAVTQHADSSTADANAAAPDSAQGSSKPGSYSSRGNAGSSSSSSSRENDTLNDAQEALHPGTTHAAGNCTVSTAAASTAKAQCSTPNPNITLHEWGREGVLWAELWLLGGLPKSQLKAAAKAVSSSSSSSRGRDAAQPSAASTASSTSEISSSSYSSSEASTAANSRPSWILFRRRRDAAVLLLELGLAQLSPQEDTEWLGVRPATARAYAR
jgi:hypothetical protein